MKEIVIVDPEMDYYRAISAARRFGVEEFKWRDILYHTRTCEFMHRMLNSSIKKQRRKK